MAGGFLPYARSTVLTGATGGFGYGGASVVTGTTALRRAYTPATAATGAVRRQHGDRLTAAYLLGYHNDTRRKFTVKDSAFTRNDELPPRRPRRRSPPTPYWSVVAVVPERNEKVQPGSTPCVANEHERNDRLALRCYGNSSFQPVAFVRKRSGRSERNCPARAARRLMGVLGKPLLPLPPGAGYHGNNFRAAESGERRANGCPFLIPLLCTGSVVCCTNALSNLVETCREPAVRARQQLMSPVVQRSQLESVFRPADRPSHASAALTAEPPWDRRGLGQMARARRFHRSVSKPRWWTTPGQPGSVVPAQLQPRSARTVSRQLVTSSPTACHMPSASSFTLGSHTLSNRQEKTFNESHNDLGQPKEPNNVSDSGCYEEAQEEARSRLIRDHKAHQRDDNSHDPTSNAAREKCRQLIPNTSQRPTPDSHRLERHSERGGSAAALSSATKPELSRCVFCCSKEHNLENCTSPLTIKEKKDKLKVENRCFRCTKQFHRSRECRSAYKLSCEKCSGKHLTVMCDPEWAATTRPTNTSSTPPQFIGISSSSTTAHNQVLLQTARIRASGQTETSLRAQIDGGSQRTFIRRYTSERLGCRPVGEEELTIFAFGDSGRGTKRNCRRVELVLRSHHGPAEIVVEALEVPEICGEILTLPDGDIIRNLQRQGITLADLPVGNCLLERGVSILIGADYYWRVTTGNVRRVNLSLTAVETIFGWSLQEPIKVSNAANVCLTTTVFKIHDDDEPPRFGHGNTPARPIRDDRKPYEDEKPTVRFDDRGDTPARPIKGDRNSYDSAGRSLSTSSPVDFYGRPVQVLTGEKAHQQEELLRRKSEKAQRRKAFEQDILEEEARGLPEERAPIMFDPPSQGRQRANHVHTGEKAAQAEALLREQYERVQSRMRESKRLQEARRPPEEQTFDRQPQMPQRGDIPLRERGDREDVTRESPRHLVTFRPWDYFGHPVQVLTGEKEAQVEEMLRKQYGQYRQQLNGRMDRNKEEAVGRLVELERRPVQPPLGRVTSSLVDHFGRSVQKPSGEKSGQQTELLRRMYERAESSRSIQELRRRPVEEVDRTSHRLKVLQGVEGTSLGRNEWKIELDKLTPDVRESYLKDLRKARMKEETDPVRANRFLSRYQNTWKSRASQHTKSLDKEPANDALNEDNVDVKDDHDGSYDQTCLHDRKQGTSFFSAPKVKHAYVYKYERKVLTRPPISKDVGNTGKQ
ncbi:hypothetical protein HPB47_001065 [Ixodes persulcatus]|uniref:Uncharacterized protein n=1 Tax=Ixodes persulcatus TaxID=34615 RepID=A0AC60PQ36_IXOPE|nr:hypothetical protein HPB47_001065 [Ixodes persulcatus]